MNKNIYQLMFFGFMSFSVGLYADAPDQTGTGCANGTQYCENNNLNTTNTTTTNNTNSNTNSNTNVNTSTNNNTNINTTTATNTNTSTSTANNSNTNVNTSTATNTNVNTTTANSTATTDNTNSNTNVNTSTSTSNSTVNSTVNQNVSNTSTTDNTNTNVNTSTSTNNSTNVNKNESKSESNVQTNNVNQNNNNSKSDNTNRNINESNSTQTINQNIETKAPPASAIAPSIMSYSQDLCTVGRSGAYQGQVFGISTGRTVTDENCERLKLSKYIYDMGMKVAAVSILCQDTRVFKAMEMAGTPCPYMGKIGKEASEGWKTNPSKRPDAKEYKANWIKQCKQGLNPNDTGYNVDVVSGVRKVLTKKTKSTKQCKKNGKMPHKEEKWITLCFIASLILSGIFALGLNKLQAEYIYEANQSLYQLQTNANNYEGELAYSISDDGVSPAIDLSFNFTFYGQTFSQARIATNGCLHFKTSGSYCNDYTPDPLTGQHTYTLYPFWTDLIRDNNSRIKSWGDSSKMIFGWYDLREYNRSNTDNSFEIILWPNNTFEYRYGGLNVINHDVLIGEIGSGTSQSYTYLYHDECSTGTTNSSSCVNTNWNNTSSNTTLENGGSLYGVGTGNSIDCSDPLNNQSCSGYAAAYLTQQCNITQLYSESCPSYWEAYDDQQCSEDSQYAPFCPGYTQEASVAYFVEDDFDYGYQDNMQGDSFGFDDNFGFEEDVFTYIEEFDFESNEEVFVFEYEDVFGSVGFEEPLFDDIDPLPDFNVINDVYEIQLFDEPEFLLSYDEFERNDVITINPSEELIEEFILQETVLIEDFEQINTFVEFETIEELDEWLEEELSEEREEPQEEIEEELYAEEEIFEEEAVEEIFEEIEEQFAEEERVALEEREEEILEEEETELIAEERTSRSGITSTMLNVVNQSLRTASYSNTSSGSSSTGYSSGNNNSSSSSNVNSGVSSSSVSGGGISTSSSPSMSDQIASANVQTNTILSLSQDTSSMSGGSSQTVSSVSTVITPMPTFDNNPQVVMADVQVQNMQGQIDTAVSGVMTASEADQIADQIIANNIKEQQEQAETEQEETGQYADESTLIAYLGYVPAFEIYKTYNIPKQETWYQSKDIYNDINISDNVNAFYGLASNNISLMNNMIRQQPNL